MRNGRAIAHPSVGGTVPRKKGQNPSCRQLELGQNTHKTTTRKSTTNESPSGFRQHFLPYTSCHSSRKCSAFTTPHTLLYSRKQNSHYFLPLPRQKQTTQEEERYVLCASSCAVCFVLHSVVGGRISPACATTKSLSHVLSHVRTQDTYRHGGKKKGSQ